MEYVEAKEKYLQAWGTLGSSWGINKAMAQIHALLLVSPRSLSTDEIMDELNISRGNANMNIRSLVEWGIVIKELKPGERKEYFSSEKDLWTLAKQVIMERRKRELQPIIKVLDQVAQVEVDGTPETQEFKKMAIELQKFVGDTDLVLNGVVKAEGNWFFKSFFKLFR